METKTAINLRASAHAYKRAKERLGWNSTVLQRMLKIAYYQGIKVNKNKLSCFLFNIPQNKKYKIRIYGENVYFFTHTGKLITIYRLQNSLIKYIKFQKK